MKYTVKYRKIGCFFWRTLKNVKADLTMSQEANMPVRVFVLEDETRVEIPALLHEFRFCPKRFSGILKQMEAQAGQKIAIKEE
jgi:hypothetical protein